ncbi:hypothetical protein HFN98_24675 [Rhizobium laguerreae]|uniref:hypothetical protein n=1 Tax=Rhizobium laguerreae TaxID=1076926 RepID=UPI001C920066|nr:hypothetical protein [Rhizobium laguerreae]MBY3333789.1 hypothetical protein [Rhizobium laguerreae]
MMGKFKVGDRVRRIRYLNSEEMKIGDTGTVTEVDADGDCRVKPDKGGDDQFNFARYLELVAAAPAVWTPKVGDKVRWRGVFKASMYTVGKVYEIHKSNGSTLYVTDNNDEKNHTWNAKSIREHFDLVEPLTITAGKFYKTRDGRKVGPMLTWPRWNGESHYDDRLCEKIGDGRHWLLNGEGHGDTDLIAEWVDELAAPAKASNDNAAPAKFKVGDLVELTSDGYAADVGATAYIRSVRADGMFDIEWVRNSLRNGQRDGRYYLLSFKLATEPTTPAIVALIENGVAKPSFEPKVHASEADATVEAERLAGVYRGQRFGIFVLSDTREADVPTYDHEWQNFAARGEKIRAIKELRSITGMGLKPATDAVEYFLAAA